MSTHRIGKIARLPRDLRQILNERLADNESGPSLLSWLNADPEVKEVLDDQFGGRPITQQNLSAWQTGGYRQWERAQETRARVHEYLDDAAEVHEEMIMSTDDPTGRERCSLLDKVGDRMAVVLLELFHEAEDAEKGPRRTRDILEIARELGRLRRADHARQHAEIVQFRWFKERDLAIREQRMENEREEAGQVSVANAYADGYRDEWINGMVTGRLLPRREKWIREYFARNAKRFAEMGIAGIPEGQDLVEAMEDAKERLMNPPPLPPELEILLRRTAAKPKATAAQTSQNKATQGEFNGQSRAAGQPSATREQEPTSNASADPLGGLRPCSKPRTSSKRSASKRQHPMAQATGGGAREGRGRSVRLQSCGAKKPKQGDTSRNKAAQGDTSRKIPSKSNGRQSPAAGSPAAGFPNASQAEPVLQC